MKSLSLLHLIILASILTTVLGLAEKYTQIQKELSEFQRTRNASAWDREYYWYEWQYLFSIEKYRVSTDEKYYTFRNLTHLTVHEIEIKKGLNLDWFMCNEPIAKIDHDSYEHKNDAIMKVPIEKLMVEKLIEDR